MKAAVASAFLALLAITPCGAKQKHCTFRVHVEANANDGSVFSTSVRSPVSGKNLSIEKTPTISERDVAAFRPVPSVDGTSGVLIQLNQHGQLALDTLSIEHRGALLFVLVNGRLITELQIDRRVSDGKIYLPSGLTTADLALMQKDWPLIGARKK